MRTAGRLFAGNLFKQQADSEKPARKAFGAFADRFVYFIVRMTIS